MHYLGPNFTLDRVHNGRILPIRPDNVLDFLGALLIRVDSIIFPVVLAHELWMGIERAPIVFIIGEDALYVDIMLARGSDFLTCVH